MQWPASLLAATLQRYAGLQEDVGNSCLGQLPWQDGSQHAPPRVQVPCMQLGALSLTSAIRLSPA